MAELNVCNDFQYPSYDYVCIELLKFDWEFHAEYGTCNHEFLKILWENIDDENIIKTIGSEINERGGITALTANYYTFLHVMRLAVKGSVEKYRESFIDIKNTISRNWNGVGEWRN
jgi:hypothetical protein